MDHVSVISKENSKFQTFSSMATIRPTHTCQNMCPDFGRRPPARVGR